MVPTYTKFSQQFSQLPHYLLAAMLLIHSGVGLMHPLHIPQLHMNYFGLGGVYSSWCHPCPSIDSRCLPSSPCAAVELSRGIVIVAVYLGLAIGSPRLLAMKAMRPRQCDKYHHMQHSCCKSLHTIEMQLGYMAMVSIPLK